MIQNASKDDFEDKPDGPIRVRVGASWCAHVKKASYQLAPNSARIPRANCSELNGLFKVFFGESERSSG